MTEKTAAWDVGPDATGALLLAAVERINGHGPFVVDDPVTLSSPRRAHLIRGRFEVVNPPSDYHYWISTQLAGLLQNLIGDRGVSIGPCGVRTRNDTTLREADVLVHLGLTVRDLRGEAYARQAPALVVEVLSPSTRAADRGEKKEEYEAIGVREYYLLDPESESVEAFRLMDGRFVPFERDSAGFASVVLQATWDPASVLETT